MDLTEKIKEFVYKTWGSSNINRFPGPQPISIERRHFQYVKAHEYFVCEKTDGIRHILVCFMDGPHKICALVNRSFQYKLYSLTVHKNTLLDGELLGDTFVVHDAVSINGEDLRFKNLNERLEKIHAFCKVIIPGKIKVMAKRMIPLGDIKKLELGKNTDGIILTPVKEQIRLGTHRTMYKWKENSNNTVDFIVHNGFLCIQNESSLMSIQEFQGEENQILECVYTSGSWKPIIVRKDKSHPNNLRTFERTKVNILENITLDELKNEFGKGD
jgi:hypothetical protein